MWYLNQYSFRAVELPVPSLKRINAAKRCACTSKGRGLLNPR